MLPSEHAARGGFAQGYRYTYDRAGRRLTATAPGGILYEQNTYDDAGRLIRQIDGARYSYDLAGRQTMVTTPEGACQQFVYDAMGYLTATTDAMGNTTSFTVDAWGRTTHITKADGSHEAYTYDHAGKKGLSGSKNNAPQTVNYGDQYTKNGRKKVLKPDVEYTTPEGYTYRTDSNGRLVNASGRLKKGVGKRNDYAQATVGKGNGRKSYDDGGHLIASIFKGSGNKDNLVPMNKALNRGDWKSMESKWRKAIQNRKNVKVDITPIYSNSSQRPSAFYVEYKIGNNKTVREYFTNI